MYPIIQYALRLLFYLAFVCLVIDQFMLRLSIHQIKYSLPI